MCFSCQCTLRNYKTHILMYIHNFCKNFVFPFSGGTAKGELIFTTSIYCNVWATLYSYSAAAKVTWKVKTSLFNQDFVNAIWREGNATCELCLWAWNSMVGGGNNTSLCLPIQSWLTQACNHLPKLNATN